METIKTIFQKIYEIKNSHFSKKAQKPKVSPGLTLGILRYQLTIEIRARQKISTFVEGKRLLDTLNVGGLMLLEF